MKIKLLNPLGCLLHSRNSGDIIEVYWDEPNECWREIYKEGSGSTAFFKEWWEKGFFEFVEKRITKEDASTFDKIKTLTMNHKDIEISFEDGMIVVRNWDIRFKEPVDYHVDTIEQLEEFMDAFEVVMKFCKVEDA